MGLRRYVGPKRLQVLLSFFGMRCVSAWSIEPLGRGRECVREHFRSDAEGVANILEDGASHLAQHVLLAF